MTDSVKTGSSFGAEVPRPDRDSARYWAALTEGRLELQRCSDCARWAWPPRPVCSNCRGMNLEWQTADSTGSIYSWIVTHHAYLPAFAHLVPYVVALVRLDLQDDILIPGRLLDPDGGDIRQGMKVRGSFQPLDSGIGLMNWQLR